MKPCFQPGSRFRIPIYDVSKYQDNPIPAIGESLNHDSANGHVSGAAAYVDDVPPLKKQYYACIGGSHIAHGKILSLDLTAVQSAVGVVDVIQAKDIPGKLDIGPVFPGDPLLSDGLIEYYGQPIFAVAAISHDHARHAVLKAKIEYQKMAPVLDLEQAVSEQFYVRPPHTMRRGKSSQAIRNAKYQKHSVMTVGGQEHFYLEGQVSLSIPGENRSQTIYTSTQNPTETQKLVAEVLNLAMNQIDVVSRRMGGGFGGKETHAAPWSCIAAVFTDRTGVAVSCRLCRRDDMIMTGKRHNFRNQYEVGFDDQGAIHGVNFELAGQCGYSPDLSDAIVDRAMFHCDNAYYYPHVTVDGLRCKTHTVSNTAFRGFGGPQGVIAGEAMLDEIAYCCQLDPLEVRKRNFYDTDKKNITQYHQTIDAFNIPKIVEQLEDESDYQNRRREINAFNVDSPILKKGIALTPVKFGISFTVSHLNQAGALIHLYTDGSIHLNHGGTEMGQGLMVKIVQIVAEVFQVNPKRIIVSATRTDKVPNTSPTAASSGTDINGMAALNAATTLKNRLIDFLATKHDASADEIHFDRDCVTVKETSYPFEEVTRLAWLERISLSATGFYKTPKIYYDRETASGRPFLYFANGAAVSEVIIDTLTGESKLLRTDIIHDVGNSINPAIDIGQIEGGFIQGTGWLTSEELKWDSSGRLLSDGPATYKIPAISDAPDVFNVRLLENHPNEEPTVFRSKAVGEPPLMLGISVWSAIRDAIGAIANHTLFPHLNAPATPEEILRCITALKAEASSKEGAEK